jgi:hypothetical protein
VNLWGKSDRDGSIYHATLTPADIEGEYANLVNLAPQIPSDDVQAQTLGLRLIEGGVISKRTFRDKYAGMALPADEQLRVELEKAMEADELRPKVLLRAIQQYYPDDWAAIIAGTPVEQMALAETQPPGVPGPMPGAMPPGNPPPNGPPGMTPGLPGIAPALQGQLTPQALGLPPQLAAPGMYQDLNSVPRTPREELEQLLGLPPQPPPP